MNNLFYVVDSASTDEEIFTSKRNAQEWLAKLPKEDSPRMRLCKVNYAYLENDKWTYEDHADTFETIAEITIINPQKGV